MTSLVLLASLLGAVLGQFFKVLVLFPAIMVSILFILAISEYGNDGPAWIALKIAVFIPSIAVGYIFGQTAIHIPGMLKRLRTYRAHSAHRPASTHQ